MNEPPTEHEHRVTPLELFFDLVFVFGFTQVTTLMADDTSWSGLAEGLLVLAAIWWAWTGYAWLTNAVDPEEGAVRGAMLVAIVAMFIAALAVPDVFDEHGVLFGVLFLIVRLMHVSLYALAGRGDHDLLLAVLRITPLTAIGSLLIIVAGFADADVKPAIWLLALSIDYLGPVVSGARGWSVHPEHFCERHGLILIIALGEAFIAIGLGAADTSLGAGVILTAVLGLVVATSMWLAYFDFFSIRAPLILAERSGHERNALARDLFSYLHFPMIAGIVLVALGLKTTIGHYDEELGTVAATALFGGSSLYLLAYSAVRLRLQRRLSRGRFVTALVFLALLPAAFAVPALAAVALATIVWLAFHAYELIWWREARAETRALRSPAG